jgi:hypothetical protein
MPVSQKDAGFAAFFFGFFTEPFNKFFAINWSQYGQASNKSEMCDTFVSAFMDCEHTHEFGAEAQSWKEYSQVVEINPAGDIVNSTYFVTL